MAEETPQMESNNMMYYVVGAVVVVAIAAGVYFLRPQQSTNEPATTPVAETQAQITPATGPIGGLACEQQYYNPVIGFPQYYLSVDGADSSTTKSVECEFIVSVGGEAVATETAQAKLVANAERGGQTFTCKTQGLTLEKTVPTKVDVLLSNDAGVTASCSRVFQLP